MSTNDLEAFKNATTPETRAYLQKHLRYLQDIVLTEAEGCLLNEKPLALLMKEHFIYGEIIESLK